MILLSLFIAVLLAVAGTALLLLSAVGILVMPDLYNRMQAASKASTLGAGLVLLAGGCYAGQADVLVRAILIALFMFMTVPIAAHMIARAGYLAGSPLTKANIQGRLLAMGRVATSSP